jgi:hypothetical protein
VIWWWFSNPVKSPYFLAASRCSDGFPFNSRSPRRCNADAVAGWISIWSPVIWTPVDRRWDSRNADGWGFSWGFYTEK